MTNLKDDKNFRSLDNQRWEDLCYLLFKSENDKLRRSDGSGGDEGVDAYLGPYENPSVIYQFKFFSDGLGVKQVKQISDSLKKASEFRSGFEWVLACNCEPTPEATRRINQLIASYPDTSITMFYEGDIKDKLLKHPSVRRTFYNDMGDVIKGVLAMSDMDPLTRAYEGVGLYNESIIDERFVLTTTIDGDSVIEKYSLHPDYAGTPVTSSFTITSRRGIEAYEKLIRHGVPLELTADDVEVNDSDLPGVSDPDATLQSLKIIPQVNPRPASFRLYPADDADSSLTLFVDLRTQREGTELIARSNAAQKSAPILFTLISPKDFLQDSNEVKTELSITPQYIGKPLSLVARGARFLKRLSETGRLGISSPYEDISDAAFARLENVRNISSWVDQFSYIEAIERVCRYFEINPTVDDSLFSQELIDVIEHLDSRINNSGKVLTGAITFTFDEVNQEFFNSSDKQEKLPVVADINWRGAIFDVPLYAKVRYVANGAHTIGENEDGRMTLRIEGDYQFYFEKVDSLESEAPPNLS